MDFTLSEEHEILLDLSAQMFKDSTTPEQRRRIEAREDRFDRRLWEQLAAANLLGSSLPYRDGGSALGTLGYCLLVEQQGRHLAPVPLLWSEISSLAISTFADQSLRDEVLPDILAGRTVVTVALQSEGPYRRDAVPAAAKLHEGIWEVTGSLPAVPYGHVADCVLVAAREEGGSGVVIGLIDPAGPGVGSKPGLGTSGEIMTDLEAIAAPLTHVIAAGRAGHEAFQFLMNRALIGLAALQVGIAEEALMQTAAYASGRHQFGRPVASFQATAARAADAYVDLAAMRLTMTEGAWRLDNGLECHDDIHIAKWWACEGGHRIAHTCQHLHGGIGADLSYPIHRYFLWTKQVEGTLGSGSAHLAEVGSRIGTEGFSDLSPGISG